MTETQSGTVRFFDDARKFGFIMPNDGGPDVFVHIAAVQSAGLVSLHKGQRIEFVAEPDRRGGRAPRAVRVIPITSDA